LVSLFLGYRALVYKALQMVSERFGSHLALGLGECVFQCLLVDA
jgi:hypothetical protein